MITARRLEETARVSLVIPSMDLETSASSSDKENDEEEAARQQYRRDRIREYRELLKKLERIDRRLRLLIGRRAL